MTMRLLMILAALFLCGLPLATAAAERVPSQVISGRSINALAQRMIQTLKLERDEALAPAFSVPDQVLPAGRVAMNAGAPLITASYINIPVTMTLNGKFSRAVYVGYRVQKYVEQAVAAHDVAPGTVLSTGDVTMARVPFVGRQPNSTQVLVGRKTIGAYVKGQSIFIESTSVDQIVKAGSTVIMVVHDGDVRLTADVIARTGGGLGDQVIVFNPQTNKQLSGVVTGPGKVELELPGDPQ